MRQFCPVLRQFLAQSYKGKCKKQPSAMQYLGNEFEMCIEVCKREQKELETKLGTFFRQSCLFTVILLVHHLWGCIVWTRYVGPLRRTLARPNVRIFPDFRPPCFVEHLLP